VNRPIHGGSVGLAFAATNQDVARSSPAGSQPEAGLDAMKQLVHEQLWLLRTSYVLRRLRLPAFSDRLQACGLSSSRCSTRSDCSFGRAPHCTWKLLRSDINWPSSIDRGARGFASRRPIESCGRGSHTSGAAGRSAVHIVKPATVIAWHRRGFRLFWTWKSRHRIGRPALPPDVRALIRDMSTVNLLWGAPRIHGELLKLGIAVSQSTVATYMRRHWRPPSQTWRTFLTNHASQIMAADLFVVPTVTFRLLFVLIMLAHDHRQLVHVAVTAHPTAAWTAQQLRDAFSDNNAPRYLVHDRDSIFADMATTIERMNIQAVRTAPRSPWQKAYASHCTSCVGCVRDRR